MSSNIINYSEDNSTTESNIEGFEQLPGYIGDNISKSTSFSAINFGDKNVHNSIFTNLDKTSNILNNVKNGYKLKGNLSKIDPYFYKSWNNETSEKIDFLIKLCDYLRKNHKELKMVTIEVFGQGYDNDKVRGLSFAKYLKKELFNNKILEELYDDGLIDIKFYGIDKINDEIKVHDRLFICNQFSLNLNDGFFSVLGPKNEIVLIHDLNRINKLMSKTIH